MQGFIDEVVRSGGVCEREQVMNLYQTIQTLSVTPIECLMEDPSIWDVAAGMDIRSIQDALKPMAEGHEGCTPRTVRPSPMLLDAGGLGHPPRRGQ